MEEEIRGKITGFDASRDLDASLAIFRFILHISDKLHQAGLHEYYSFFNKIKIT